MPGISYLTAIGDATNALPPSAEDHRAILQEALAQSGGSRP
ncbi:hypothetical protein OSJ77_12865 [Phyllobacterium sp. 0TCS1.6C]|nr:MULTISPECIES: hypothetical protein [unclassified Phyllobacterium]MCX8281085.1 hypothetical protein [Phyllobacterium sp. 0TCS1.6C]MCX8294628.1 hypothetical protein [Phyllobacterium sp. 0TCS1.6A]